MKMRKVISLLLVIGLVLSLAACGGDDQVEALAEAYNRVAPMYNEIYDKAEANGWMADPQTEAEINALSATLGPLGESLSGDRSALEDADIEKGIELLEQLEPELEKMLERVSAPYEG